MDMTIVDFRPEYADQLVRMWRDSFEQAVGVTDPHPLSEQKDYLLETVVPHNAVRVVFVDKQVVAFIAADSESIAQLYVHQAFQRRGIGTRLLNWAKQRSSGQLSLYTFQRNHIACAFYERHGFRAVEQGFEEEWQLPDVKYVWEREPSKDH